MLLRDFTASLTKSVSISAIRLEKMVEALFREKEDRVTALPPPSLLFTQKQWDAICAASDRHRAHARRAHKDLGSDGSPPRPSRVALRAAILRDAAEIAKMADYKDEDDNSKPVCTVDKKDPPHST